MSSTVQYNPEDSTVTLSYAGKTRRVRVSDTWNDGQKLVSRALNGVCRHRTGRKLYPVRLEFHLTRDGMYAMQTQYCCINRQALLVGWLEDQPELTLR